MKLQTVRVRRSRPSALSLALALMLTMLFVYLISLAPDSQEVQDIASAHTQGSGEVRMEGLEAAFLCEGRYADQLEARLAATRCVQNGGAGMILADGDTYAVVRAAVTPEDAPEDALKLSEDGLTLRLQGAAEEIAAVSDAVGFLRAQATETGSLANALESGDTDTASLAALMEIYLTQGGRAQEALAQMEAPCPIVQRLNAAVRGALLRLEDATANPDAARLRMVHAAACGEWIGLLQELRARA